MKGKIISVVICTYKRPSILRGALKSLKDHSNPDLVKEIIVVDNNSQDDTARIVKEFPLDIRYVLEAAPGIVNARNRGVKESSCEIICFLDDDSRIQKGWADEILRPFKDPSVGCVGGKIDLELDNNVPEWFVPELYPWLSSYDKSGNRSCSGASTCEINNIRDYPVGANIAFRKAALESVGLFPSPAGRCGLLIRGEETHLCYRLKKNGWKVVFHKNAYVIHFIKSDRLTKKGVIRIAASTGMAFGDISREMSLQEKSYFLAKGIVALPIKGIKYLCLRNKRHGFYGYIDLLSTYLRVKYMCADSSYPQKER